MSFLPFSSNNIIIIHYLSFIHPLHLPLPLCLARITPSLPPSLPPPRTHSVTKKEKDKNKRTMLAIPPTILPIPTSWASAAWISSSLFLIYLASLVIYRLYWSPLAKIPGPKLAAATFWYEFYYDVVRRGRYTWKIGELHEEYGMFIRGVFVWMEEESWGRGRYGFLVFLADFI